MPLQHHETGNSAPGGIELRPASPNTWALATRARLGPLTLCCVRLCDLTRGSSKPERSTGSTRWTGGAGDGERTAGAEDKGQQRRRRASRPLGN